MSNQENKLIIFQSQEIRRIWHEDDWFYSVVDVCGALTQSPDAGAYWHKLKQRLNQEGSEVVTIYHGLKLVAPDGKKRVTDCANAEGIFRIIQSIPSPKAEPFKRWLAKVGQERMKVISQVSYSESGANALSGLFETGKLLRERILDMIGMREVWHDRRYSLAAAV